MRVSIEWFLFDNWVMNAATLLLASALSGLRARWLAGGFLALLGAVYALMAMWQWPFLLILPIRLLMGAALSLGLRFTGLRDGLRALLCVYFGSLLLGGLLFALSQLEGSSSTAYGFVDGMLVGSVRTRAALLCAPLAALTPRMLRYLRSTARVSGVYTRVRITVAGEKKEARALIDTGNLLTEPITGLPVMLLADCPSFPDGYPVRYTSMGGDGELIARRADTAQVYINRQWRAIDVMVAKAPHSLARAEAVLGAGALPPDDLPGQDRTKKNTYDGTGAGWPFTK